MRPFVSLVWILLSTYDSYSLIKDNIVGKLHDNKKGLRHTG